MQVCRVRVQSGLILLAVAWLCVATACDRPTLEREKTPAGKTDVAAGLDTTPLDTGGDQTEASGCGSQTLTPGQALTTDPRVETILSSLTLKEKIAQMGGDIVMSEMFLTPDNTKLGVRGLRFRDGPRGVRQESGTATCFPVSVARAATFDLDLEERIGAAMGREVKAVGYNTLLSPTINTLRHPAWGRGQETYGEDPWYLGKMGIAAVRGIQKHVPACVKHFACNNIEDTRMTNNAVVDPQTLRENYTRQFEMVVKQSDVACVMAAYNKVNGHYCCENQPLLRTLLKGEWNFDGFVVSDWLAAQSTVESALGGLDVEMPWRLNYDGLQMAVSGGQVQESVIDDAVRRILRIKFKFGFALLAEPFTDDPAVVEGPEHVDLALEAALKGTVLLKNRDNTLPLDRDTTKKIAVVGRFADEPRLGDAGSSNVVPSYAVSPYAGLAAVAGPGIDVVTSNDASAASGADVAVVVVALTQMEEGEAVFGGGDRDTLNVSADQEALIRQVAGMAGKTVVVIEAGGPITMEGWKNDADAIVMAWYPGMEGGTAIASLLFGDENFTGRLPQTWPVRWEDCPEFGNKLSETVFDYYHGYRHFDHHDIEPLFPFAFGLSYTTFQMSNLHIPCSTITPDARLVVQVDVENTGDREGVAVPLLFVSYPDTTVRRPSKEFKGFARVQLQPGEKATVSIELDARDLAYFDAATNQWVVELARHQVLMGDHARNLPLAGEFHVGSQGTLSEEVQ
jgi:beta-glucosidase